MKTLKYKLDPLQSDPVLHSAGYLKITLLCESFHKATCTSGRICDMLAFQILLLICAGNLETIPLPWYATWNAQHSFFETKRDASLCCECASVLLRKHPHSISTERRLRSRAPPQVGTECGGLCMLLTSERVHRHWERRDLENSLVFNVPIRLLRQLVAGRNSQRPRSSWGLATRTLLHCELSTGVHAQHLEVFFFNW